MTDYYRLEVGDRVCFWQPKRYSDPRASSHYPWGTVSKVTDAGFFPYWVKWDDEGEVGCEGGFQVSCFNWEEMKRVGHTAYNLNRRAALEVSDE